VNERPVSLSISDDLRRGHGSVLFRAWFALPFILWLGIWAVASFFVAIVNWVATLVLGRSPKPLCRFLIRFVRYATHTYAYLNLAVEPLPSFDGKPGYPIDLEVRPPDSQNRWTVAFRLILAVPALLLATVLAGASPNVYAAFFSGVNLGGISIIGTAAFLGWFFALALARMPRGLRDLIAYAVSYGAQFWAYLLLLTDSYPSSDPLTAIGSLPVCAHPVWLETRDDLRRSRLTVFFRILLAIPHLVWLTLWGVVALVAALVNWFATLVEGVSPQALHGFLATYVRYQLHVGAYVYLVGNPFPGFTGTEGRYPIDLHIAGPAPQSRWAVLFRLVLAVPAVLLANAYTWLVLLVAFLGWFAGLFTGRMPVGLRNAGALALRYIAQTYAYLFLVTGVYPYSGPCLASPPVAAEPEIVPPPLPVSG
jgi:hypothetical protein